MLTRARPSIVFGARQLAFSSVVQSRTALRAQSKASQSLPTRMNSTIQTIFTKKSYAPIGHYSQAFAANGQVWVAGQVAADPEGNLVQGSVTDQAHQICRNLNEILKTTNSSLEKVVKVTVYVNDFSILPEFNTVYNDYFPQKPPRTSMEVSRLPLDVQIEVDVIAII